MILMTAFGTIETAVAAMKQGAFDYITKPFSGDELLVAVERAVDHGELVQREPDPACGLDAGDAPAGTAIAPDDRRGPVMSDVDGAARRGSRTATARC